MKTRNDYLEKIDVCQGPLTSLEAKARLKDEENGAFLILFSASTNQYFITIKVGEGKFKDSAIPSQAFQNFITRLHSLKGLLEKEIDKQPLLAERMKVINDFKAEVSKLIKFPLGRPYLRGDVKDVEALTDSKLNPNQKLAKLFEDFKLKNNEQESLFQLLLQPNSDPKKLLNFSNNFKKNFGERDHQEFEHKLELLKVYGSKDTKSVLQKKSDLELKEFKDLIQRISASKDLKLDEKTEKHKEKQQAKNELNGVLNKIIINLNANDFDKVKARKELVDALTNLAIKSQQEQKTGTSNTAKAVNKFLEAMGENQLKLGDYKKSNLKELFSMFGDSKSKDEHKPEPKTDTKHQKKH